MIISEEYLLMDILIISLIIFFCTEENIVFEKSEGYNEMVKAGHF